jgi:RNA polymerase sigma-70 factor (ECF subfamily)
LSRDNESEERLLIEAAQKDPGRFAELYEENFHRVYAYIARRVSDRSEAQDLTSHVFHQALANLGKFKWRGAPFATWLFRIAANSIVDQAKRRAREQGENTERPATDNPAETDLEDSERRAYLFRAVDKLPEDQRRVILLRFAAEKSVREIASELGRSEGAVKQLQFRGLENLRARLSDKFQLSNTNG